METGHWLRIGAILALLVGAIYVLLPTVLQEDAQTRNLRAATQVEAPAGTGADLDVVFDVQGSAPETAQALQARLDTLGVDVSRVTADADRVTVRLAPGTSREDVVQAIALPAPEVAWYDASSVLSGEGATGDTVIDDTAAPALPASTEAALAERYADSPEAVQALAALAGEPMPEGAAPAGVTPGTLNADGLFADASGPDVLIAVVDGTVRGLAVTTDEGRRYLPLLEGDDGASNLLALGPLPGTLTPVADAPEAEAEVEATEPAPSSIPPWLAGVLPDTRMNLGIDLQGGIDLTLTVDLEEAVLARVRGDAASLRRDIEREFSGTPAEGGESKSGGMFGGLFGGSDMNASELAQAWQGSEVVADRDVPVLRIRTEVPLADLQSYLLGQYQDYEYDETVTTEEGDVHLFVMSTQAQDDLADEAVEQVVETLRKRVDATGVKEPSITQKGDGNINVQLPGEVDLKQAVAAIGTTALLEFQLVDEEFETTLRERGFTSRPLEDLVALAEQEMPEAQFLDDELLNRWLQDNGHIPLDREIRWEYVDMPEGEPIRQYPYPLKQDDDPLTGADVSHAGVAWDQNQQPIVSLEFKSRGANKFCELTSANVGKRFAILLDDEVQSAPNIRDAICGGRAQIEMGQGIDPLAEANTLALVLRTGSLNAPVNIGDVRTIGSTLGQDAIRAGSIATMIGGALVLLFMALWYRTAGLLANVALVINVLLVLATLAMFGATLTLPGIAGIALTVGMAVDANIIVFERIREELSLGQNVRKAVESGFDKALSAILDGNITTAVAGIVLFSYGTGPIKGFAVTLLIGIATTLISALFVTRSLIEIATRSSTARLKI